MMEPTAEHKYGSLNHVEDHDGESSTEVDESLMGDEEKQLRYSGDVTARRPRRTFWGKMLAPFKSGRWLIDTALLLVIIGLLLRDQWRRDAAAASTTLQVGGDFTGVGPSFQQKITTFKMDPSYAPNDTLQFFTDETLNKWNALMPKGMGFVWVNDTHKYHDLPTPIMWPDKTVFTTSVTHHLHCLFAVVQTYSGLKSGHPIPDDHHWHMIHCFDYMRQAIMCSSDIALEGLETTFPDHNGGSDGWDSKHVCKDYSQVKDYLESVRAYDDQQIY